jgi:hypothetical protein
MGIFDFLKKIFSEPEEAVQSTQKVNFSDIEKFVKEKINGNNSKEKEIILTIFGEIDIFVKELKEKIGILEKIDIESKEKNDKIKSAVYEGRKKYIEFIERFIENIEGEKEAKLEKIMENINSAFLRLNENSAKSYERATILIGKEMGNIKETLKNLSNELITIFKDSKEIVTNSNRLFIIELRINELKNLKQNSKKIDEEIKKLTNKIKAKQEESKEISEKIKEIKESLEYIENIAKQEEIKIQEEKVEKEIIDLKQIIDFKALSNFFHIFEDRMAIVKLYREDFTIEFKKDKGSRLLNLLNESKLNSEKIYDSIKNIQDKEKEIEDGKANLKKDETLPLLSELEKVNELAQGFMNEIGWAEKKNEKLKASQEETLKIIKDELKLMGVDLED